MKAEHPEDYLPPAMKTMWHRLVQDWRRATEPLSVKGRSFPCTGIDQRRREHFLPLFLATMKPPKLIDDRQKVAHFVSCIPYEEKKNSGGSMWFSPDFFVMVRKGQSIEHALLHVSLLAGIPERAFVCLGTTWTRERHAWVCTFEISEEDKAAKGAVQSRDMDLTKGLFAMMGGQRQATDAAGGPSQQNPRATFTLKRLGTQSLGFVADSVANLGRKSIKGNLRGTTASTATSQARTSVKPGAGRASIKMGKRLSDRASHIRMGKRSSDGGRRGGGASRSGGRHSSVPGLQYRICYDQMLLDWSQRRDINPYVFQFTYTGCSGECFCKSLREKQHHLTFTL